MGTITCKKCEVAQDSSEFYKNGKGFWTRECKTCKAARGRKRRLENQAYVRAQGRKNAAASRKRHLQEIRSKQREQYTLNPEKYREARRQYYWRYPEKSREAVKKSYRLNPTRAREYAKQWRLKHLERAKRNRIQWGINNPDKIKKSKQRDYQKHKKYIRAKNIAWEKANPEKLKLIRQAAKGRRRAQIQANGFEKFSLKEILQRDGYRCHICGKRVSPKELSFDHLIPISKGGSHTRLNIGVAHLLCNIKRGAGRIAAQLRLV